MLQNWDENYDSISLSLSAPTFAPSWHMCVCVCVFTGAKRDVWCYPTYVWALFEMKFFFCGWRSHSLVEGEKPRVYLKYHMYFLETRAGSNGLKRVLPYDIVYNGYTKSFFLRFDSFQKKKKKKKTFSFPHQKKGRTIHIPPKKAPPNLQIISTFQQVYNQPTDHPPPVASSKSVLMDTKKRKKGGPGGKGGQGITKH